MTVDRATILELPQIEAMRDAYFAARDLPVQRRFDATWYVARVGESVKGCYAVQEQPGELWLVDLYRVPGAIGARAIEAMFEHLFVLCGDRPLMGMVDPGNEAMLEAYLRREARPVAVVLRWKRDASRTANSYRDYRRSRPKRGLG